MTARTSRLVALLAAIVAALTLAIPLYVIRPFRPQGQRELAVALEVRDIAPWLAAFCAIAAIYLLLRTWSAARIATRAWMLLCSVVALSSAALTHVNIFERMFHPYPDATFAKADEASIDADDHLLSVTIDSQTHAFPIRAMGYHHIVNDTLAGVPIAATYCTLCHTGIVYDRRLFIDGRLRTLYFTLAGINNGNALLRDTRTGSIWQQSTGEAIFGPLKGRQLHLIPSDELSFALWRKEWPESLILKPDTPYVALYDPRDWEARIAKTHVVVDVSSSGIDPHTIMLGIASADQSKAFPLDQLLAARLVEDHLGDKPLLLIVGQDGASIRVFMPRLADQPNAMHFTVAPEAPGHVTDRETGSIWSFAGCAIYGPLFGKCLPQIEAHKDYWFDWLNHHPDTIVYRG